MKLNVVKDKFYVYKWFIVETNEVFYIGKGINNRYKDMRKRNPYFKNIIEKYSCNVEIIDYYDDEEDAFQNEIKYIEFYKSIGEAKANFHEGGLGGNTFKYASDEKKLQFRNKMLEINKKRCSSEVFKENARKNMIKRYQDPEERKKQSNIQRNVWTEEKRKKQSDLLKEKFKDIDLKKKMIRHLERKCMFEFNDDKRIFNSRIEALNYIKENYNIVFARKIEQDMLHNKTPYIAYHKQYKHLNGMKLYYIED